MSVLALASLVVTQAPVSLLFQPKVGSTIKYAVTTSQNSPMGGGAQTTSMTTTMKILSVANGVYKIDSSTSNVKVSGGMGSDQMKKMLEGKHVTMSVDKYGSPKLDGKNMGAGMEMMRGFGGNSTGMLFSKKPVKVGDTWSNSIDLGEAVKGAGKAAGAPGMAGAGKITTTYKLVKIDGSTATVSVSMTGKMDMDMGGGRGKANGQSMKMSMTMGGTGQTLVDRGTGTIVNSSLKMNMSIMGQNVAITTTTKKI